ncbi:MAG: winged helix-turn-helix transcriptional regulator [Methanobacteriaceae archaeon]|nr:winged helix-turn-helix transcriptional regulator [Methanobacteriaceae archaeon]
MKIFKKRGEMTHFQILSEISKNEPNLKQKDLAERLGITIQAVSENIKTLIEQGYITSEDGRSPYTITQQGIAKVKKDAIALRKYSDETLEIMNYYKSVWPAIATEEIKKGDTVGLYMKNGLLYADHGKHEAIAEAVSDAHEGSDVALNQLTGLINVEHGQVLIIALPTIKQGGSNNANLDLVKEIYTTTYTEWGLKHLDKVGVIGTISHVVANKLEIPIDIEFASAPASVSCSKKGLNVLLLAVGNMTKNIVKTLEDNDIKYNIVDAKL